MFRLIILLMLISAGPVSWSTLKSGRFEVLFLPRSEGLARRLEPRLEPEIQRVSMALATQPPAGPIRIVVLPDQRSFMQMARGAAPPWVSGLAQPEKSLIYLRPLSGMEVRHSSIEHVLAHELAHLVLHEKVKGNFIPRWLDEGTAVYMGGEPFFSRAESLFPIAVTGRSIPLRRLEDYFPDNSEDSATAYAESGDFVRFLIDEKGRDKFLSYLDFIGKGEKPDDAMRAAFGVSLFDLETEWLSGLRKTYALFPMVSGVGLWFFISLLAILAYLRRRTDKKMRRMAEDGLTWDDYRAERDRGRVHELEYEDDFEDDFDDDDDNGYPGGYLH